jgi:hypothetical protein
VAFSLVGAGAGPCGGVVALVGVAPETAGPIRFWRLAAFSAEVGASRISHSENLGCARLSWSSEGHQITDRGEKLRGVNEPSSLFSLSAGVAMPVRFISRRVVSVLSALLLGGVYFLSADRAYAPPIDTTCYSDCACKLVSAWWDQDKGAPLHLVWIDEFGQISDYQQAMGSVGIFWARHNCDSANSRVNSNDGFDYPVYSFLTPTEICDNGLGLSRQMMTTRFAPSAKS